jgi:hypothetical protein
VSLLSLGCVKKSNYDGRPVRISAETEVEPENNTTDESPEEPFVKREYAYTYVFGKEVEDLKNVSRIETFYLRGGKGYSQKAADILWQYILDYFENHNPSYTEKEIGEKFNIHKVTTWATFADLDDDGQDEIIGFHQSTYFMGSISGSLFILKKTGNKYEEINYASINTDTNEIRILKSKTNGFHDIEMYANPELNKDKGILKYKKQN